MHVIMIRDCLLQLLRRKSERNGDTDRPRERERERKRKNEIEIRVNGIMRDGVWSCSIYKLAPP